MNSRERARRYALVLSLLLAAFVARVLAQLLQVWTPRPWLPPFEAWHSGLFPYPLLVASQLIIIGLALRAIVALLRRRTSSRGAGRVLVAVGALYLTAMVGRFLLGLTALSHIAWFEARLPTVFLLVLASFLLVLGAFHLRTSELEPLS